MIKIWPVVRPLVFAGAIALANPTNAQKTPIYQTYSNARYGYRVDYPITLLPQPEADNGDGRVFLSPDKLTMLTIWASYNVLDETLNSKKAQDEKDMHEKGGTVTFRQSITNGYVLSGTSKSMIFYQKTMLSNGVFSTLVWNYPSANKVVMDAVVIRSVRSFWPSSGGWERHKQDSPSK